VNRFVLDASTVLTWCFPDEHSDEAQQALTFLQQGYEAVAPSFWPVEVLNALLMGERRRRITQGLTQTFLRDLQKLPVTLDSSPAPAVFADVEALARRHRMTAYDAAYLELALRQKLPVATLDRDLLRASAAEGVILLSAKLLP